VDHCWAVIGFSGKGDPPKITGSFGYRTIWAHYSATNPSLPQPLLLRSSPPVSARCGEQPATPHAGRAGKGKQSTRMLGFLRSAVRALASSPAAGIRQVCLIFHSSEHVPLLRFTPSIPRPR
jgi:hypothetical protein